MFYQEKIDLQIVYKMTIEKVSKVNYYYLQNKWTK